MSPASYRAAPPRVGKCQATEHARSSPNRGCRSTTAQISGARAYSCAVRVDAMMIPQPLSQLGDLARRPGRRVLCSRKRPHRRSQTQLSPRRPRPALSCPPGSRWRSRAVPSSRQPRRGAPGSYQREVPARSGHAGSQECGAPIRYGLPPSRSAAALPAGREGVLRRFPNRDTGSPRRVRQSRLHHCPMEPGAH